MHGFVTAVVRWYYRRIWGMDLGEGVRLSLSVKLDKTNPGGVHIGDHTFLTFRSTVLSHDFVHGGMVDTRIGSNCFIGCNVTIMPGIAIGDHCIIGAGSVVTKDIPSNSIAVGNPAKVVRSDIVTGPYGMQRPNMKIPS